MDNSQALVLGGLGFIGSNVVHLLAELGADVTVFDSMLKGYGGNLANMNGIEDQVKIVKKDMREFEELKKVVPEKDVIFNCAGQVSHSDSMTNPWLDIDINCTANINLLEACRQLNDNAKIVYCGTRAAVGKAEKLPVDEKHPTDPVDIYGIDKLASEKYHLLYSKLYGMKACVLRLTNVFGERHQMQHAKYGVMNYFVRLALEGKAIKVYGDGQQIRDLNYVRDVTEAMVIAAQNKKSDSEMYNIGSGRKIKFIEIVEKIIETVGKGSYEFVEWPEQSKAIEVGDYFVSYEKIKKDLGWAPKTTFENGLQKTVEFYRERLNDYI